MSFRAHLVSLIAVGLVAGCGQADDSPALGSLTQPIVNGALSDPSDDGVVYVYTSVPGGVSVVCTGTLIAPNLIATALHCVTNRDLGLFSCLPDGSVEENSRGDGTIGALVPAAAVQIFVGNTVGDEPAALGAQLFSTRSTQVCRNDFALVVLDRALEGLPLSSVRLQGNVAWGDQVRVLGYGQTGMPQDDAQRYVREGLRVVDVGPNSDGEATRTAAPRTFVVGQGPCHGDSGGPAFSEATGALLGVYSLSGAKDCSQPGVRNTYTSIAPFSELVLQAFDAAGAAPILEEGSAAPASTEADSGCTLTRAGQRPSWNAVWLLALGLAGLRVTRRRA